MGTAQRIPVPSHASYNTVHATVGFSFHDLISGLLGSDNAEGYSNTRPAAEPDHTPLGRHQWKFND